MVATRRRRDGNLGIGALVVALALLAVLPVVPAGFGGGYRLSVGSIGTSPRGDCETGPPLSHGITEPGAYPRADCAVHGGPAVDLGSWVQSSGISGPWTPNRTLAWSTVTPPPATAGEGAGMAADPVGGEVLLFGGEAGDVLSAVTRVYNESTDTWTTLHAPSSPSARSYFAIAADPVERAAVLFGGVTNATTLRPSNDTWVYDFPAGTWTNVSSPVAPAAREDPAFAFDPVGGFGLLYGGWNPAFTPTSTVTYSDLWKFTLSTGTWSEVAVNGSSAPPPLHGAAFTWDPSAGRFDLFGGCYPCSSSVWQFDPLTGEWDVAPVAGATLPLPREDPSWTWDPVSSMDVLFGGTDGSARFNDTFAFDPTSGTWTEETPPLVPTPRFGAASTWLNVSGNETLLLSGGNSSLPLAPDLWRLAPTSNLTVLVYNESDLEGLDGAGVSVDGGSRLSTNVDGVLNLTQLTSTETSVNVTRLGYAAVESSLWLSPGSSRRVTCELPPVAPARLSVRVMDPSGVPVANASVFVTVQGTSAPGSPSGTDDFGYSNFTSVPSEIPVPNATIQVSAAENYTNTTSIPLPPDSNDSLTIQLIPYPELRIDVTGLLEDGASVPVENASVAEDSFRIGSTQETGWLNTTSRFVGDVSLLIQATGFDPDQALVDLPKVGNLTVMVTLTGKPFGRLVVQVVGQANGNEQSAGTSVADASVSISSVPGLSSVAWSSSTTTNRTGFATQFLPAGSYGVAVSAYGYYPNTKGPVAVPSNETTVITVVLILLPGATINVTVRAAGTRVPLSEARVVVGQEVPLYTTPGGWANFTNVLFGPTFINVSHSGYLNNSTELFVTPGEVISNLWVNLTPVPTVPANGTSGFGGGIFPPPLGVLGAFVVAFGVTVVGAAVYLLYLRTPRRAFEAPVAAPTRTAPDTGADPSNSRWR